MLVKAGIYQDEKTASSRVFKDGLDEGEFDAAVAGDPDMDIDLLKGKQTTVEISDTPEDLKRLAYICRGYNVTIPKAASIVFLQGLFNHYLLLRDCRLYELDSHFRRKVNTMPHDGYFDEPEDKLKEEDF